MTYFLFFFFKQKTAYEMRISDWSSDVGSSDLTCNDAGQRQSTTRRRRGTAQRQPPPSSAVPHGVSVPHPGHGAVLAAGGRGAGAAAGGCHGVGAAAVQRAAVAAHGAVALAAQRQPGTDREIGRAHV